MDLTRNPHFALLSVAGCASVLAYFVADSAQWNMTCGLVVGCICLVASLASISPYYRSSIESITSAAVLSMAIRVFLTIIGIAAVMLSQQFETQIVGCWIIYWYMLFLTAEVVWLRSRLSTGDLPVCGGQTSC